MSIVPHRIINGFIEFYTGKNDYARALHKGTFQGFMLVVKFKCLVQSS